MSKKKHLEHHKIAVLISLLLDYAEEHPKVTKICEDVVDSLYNSVEQLRSDNYFQKISKEIEERITTDLLMIGLLAIKSLIDVKSNSKKALDLIKELEIMCNSLDQKYNINDLNQNSYKLETIMRKNYKLLH